MCPEFLLFWCNVVHCKSAYENGFHCYLVCYEPFSLTLPVQRYLVPTPSMISKKVDLTNFNFGRPLGLSMRGKTLVELMI